MMDSECIRYHIEAVLRDIYDITYPIKTEQYGYYLPDGLTISPQIDKAIHLPLTLANQKLLLDNGWRISLWLHNDKRYIATLEHDAEWNDVTQRFELVDSGFEDELETDRD